MSECSKILRRQMLKPDQAVHSSHEPLQRRIESVIQVALRTITPLAPLKPKTSWAANNGAKRMAIKSE